MQLYSRVHITNHSCKASWCCPDVWVDAVGVMFVAVRAATRQNGDTIAQIYNLYIIIEPIYEALFEINESHLEKELGLVK